MAKTIIVCGYGPGISAAVAEKFGAEGFSVALVARNAERLSSGVKALEAKGVKARAFPTDLGDTAAVRKLVGSVRAALGPVTVVHWNVYAAEAGDLLTADTAALHRALDVAVGGLLAAVQEALARSEEREGSSRPRHERGLRTCRSKVDAFRGSDQRMGVALSNAAKHKLVGLLSEKLKPDGRSTSAR